MEDSAQKLKQELNIAPGDIYEDCAFHPCLCVGIDYGEKEIWGVSLIDGSYPRSCDLEHCGVKKLNVEEAWKIKIEGPGDLPEGIEIPKEKRWW